MKTAGAVSPIVSPLFLTFFFCSISLSSQPSNTPLILCTFLSTVAHFATLLLRLPHFHNFFWLANVLTSGRCKWICWWAFLARVSFAPNGFLANGDGGNRRTGVHHRRGHLRFAVRAKSASDGRLCAAARGC